MGEGGLGRIHVREPERPPRRVGQIDGHTGEVGQLGAFMAIRARQHDGVRHQHVQLVLLGGLVDAGLLHA